MASPIPPVTIGAGSCSVIYNNTLYVYSADAFQSLPLRTNGTWSKLQNGVSLDGAVCVQATSVEGDALWVVGGYTNDTTSSYTGLQYYSFSNNTWETVEPMDNVEITKNRVEHSSVFLQETSQILVYAGSQMQPVVPSTETFLISTLPPYKTQAFSTRDTPSISPILLNWNNDSAITLGGSDDNTSIFRFDPVNGWRNTSDSLTSPINQPANVKGALVQGADGSKVLELYDLGSSPISVSQLVLQYSNGSLAAPGTTVASQSSAAKVKRDLTLANWPTYNATNAPSTARPGFSIAQGNNGLVAFAGGDAQNPVVLFDQNTNAWLNDKAFFGASATTTTSSADGTSSSSPSSSTAPSSSSTAAAAPTNNNHHRTSLILGATLGTILGVIALLLILLLLLAWRRRRKADEDKEEKDGQRLSFADRGDPEMAEAGGAVLHNNNINEKPSTPMIRTDSGVARPRSATLRSESSRTALMSPEAHQFKPSLDMSPVRPSTARSGHLAVPGTIAEESSRPNSTLLMVPGGRGSQRSSSGSGWSNYFSSNTKPEVLKAPDAAATASPRSNLTPRNSILPIFRRSKSKRDTLLNYEEMKPDQTHDCSTHGPTSIPPVSLAPQWDASRVSQDVMGRQQPTMAGIASVIRPSTNSTNPGSRHGHSRTISSVNSTNDASIFTHDAINEPGQWTPVTRQDWSTPRGRNTVTSSYYGGEEPNSDGSDPDGAIPSPSLRPGVQGGAGQWTGMASPKLLQELGQESPTPKTRIMSAERPTPPPVIMNRFEKPQSGSVENSPNPMKQAKKAEVDNMDWLRLGPFQDPKA